MIWFFCCGINTRVAHSWHLSAVRNVGRWWRLWKGFNCKAFTEKNWAMLYSLTREQCGLPGYEQIDHSAHNRCWKITWWPTTRDERTPLCNEKSRMLFSHLDDDLLFRWQGGMDAFPWIFAGAFCSQRFQPGTLGSGWLLWELSPCEQWQKPLWNCMCHSRWLRLRWRENRALIALWQHHQKMAHCKSRFNGILHTINAVDSPKTLKWIPCFSRRFILHSTIHENISEENGVVVFDTNVNLSANDNQRNPRLSPGAERA